MHTPEQANNLWCPMGRVGVLPAYGGPAGINDPNTEYRVNCSGDQCAMWRWVPAELGERHKPPTHGYCGLAGRPAA